MTLSPRTPLSNTSSMFTRGKSLQERGSAQRSTKSSNVGTYVSAWEAVWRLFGFVTVTRNPAVTACHVHPENDHRVQMPDSATHKQRLAAADSTTSDLKYLAVLLVQLTMLDYYVQYTVRKVENPKPRWQRCFQAERRCQPPRF